MESNEVIVIQWIEFVAEEFENKLMKEALTAANLETNIFYNHVLIYRRVK